MGFVRARVSGDGRARYATLYADVKGRQRSAGTYATEEQARRAWQKAEDKLSEGRLEARARENYTYYLGKHILPTFATMRLVEILPRRRPRVGHRPEDLRGLPHRHPVLLRDPVRDLHHRVQRPISPPCTPAAE